MDEDGALLHEELVDDAIVADPELEKAGKLPVERLEIDLVDPVGKPPKAFDDP